MSKTVKCAVNPHYSQIWQTVQLIPLGKVASYGQIADLAGLPGRARLVGKSLGYIPESGWQKKSVPWHRVINSQGKISFLQGSDRFEKQKNRLQSEQVVIIGARVKLNEFQWKPDFNELLFLLTF